MTAFRVVPLAAARAARSRDQAPAWILRPVEPLTEVEFTALAERWKERAPSGPFVVLADDQQFFATRTRNEAGLRAIDRYVARVRDVTVRRSWWRRLSDRVSERMSR
jgi:hypothetical protein